MNQNRSKLKISRRLRSSSRKTVGPAPRPVSQPRAQFDLMQELEDLVYTCPVLGFPCRRNRQRVAR
jgi:hypothetical protein